MKIFTVMVALLLISCSAEKTTPQFDSDTPVVDGDISSDDFDASVQDEDNILVDNDLSQNDDDMQTGDEDSVTLPDEDIDDDVDGGEVSDDELIDCSTPPISPTERLYPVVGEIFYQQIGLSGFSMGESALFIGPGGEVILIDAGNDSHDQVISSVIADTISHMNSSGFSAKSTKEIDYAIITHMHADHADGLQDLLEKLTINQKIIHRGFVDITNAADDKTVTQLCNTIANQPGHEFSLCDGPAHTSCNDWSSGFPSTGCSGLDAGDVLVSDDTGSTYISLSGGSMIKIVAANGYMAGDSYESIVGPLLTEDSNGENARSIAGVIVHGDFRLLFAGDLTGGGSDTDPVEQFYATRLSTVSDIGISGVDVLHAGHHGRDTSSSPEWINRLLPNDGLSRNMIMGISTAHLKSPYQATLTTTLANNRLRDGRAWTTTVASGGATDPLLINAHGGSLLIRTAEHGKIYHIQAVDSDGVILQTRSYYSARGCERSGH